MQFGTDDEKKGSVYYKDFTNAASKTVQKPTIVSAPVDSEVIHYTLRYVETGVYRYAYFFYLGNIFELAQ